MPDRIIRDELWNSIRWLDLPTDTHRLVYIALITIADDYGNVEGGPRRLFRWMHGFAQIKTESDSIKLMSDLQDADLVRRYEDSDKEYWHIPRFRNSRRYWSRKFPKSPFQEQENQETAKKPDAALAQDCVNPSRGVGVGVGEGRRKALDVESPTRGRVIQNQKLLKKIPETDSNPADVERNRRVAEALANNDTDLAQRIRAGIA